MKLPEKHFVSGSFFSSIDSIFLKNSYFSCQIHILNKRKHDEVFTIYFFLGFIFLRPKAENHIQWYKNQIIEQVLPETDSTYIVQIGIMAQAFKLNKNDANFEKNLKLLQESLTERKPKTIGVEQGTTKIVRVE